MVSVSSNHIVPKIENSSLIFRRFLISCYQVAKDKLTFWKKKVIMNVVAWYIESLPRESYFYQIGSEILNVFMRFQLFFKIYSSFLLFFLRRYLLKEVKSCLVFLLLIGIIYEVSNHVFAMCFPRSWHLGILHYNRAYEFTIFFIDLLIDRLKEIIMLWV